MREEVMQTAEPASTREANERLLKILDINYAEADLKQVADNETHLNAKERTQIPRILEGFEDLFDDTLGDWETEPVNLELNPYYKPFDSKYYPIPRIKKETFRKDIKRLVKIGVLTPVQQSQYGTPIFIIPKKEGTMRFIKDYRRLNQ